MTEFNLNAGFVQAREDHLTVANPKLQAMIDATPRGMMHWSGSGPGGAVCFDCGHFDQRKLRTKLENEQPETVRGACSKYDRITEARVGHPVARRIFEPTTPACSHFVTMMRPETPS